MPFDRFLLLLPKEKKHASTSALGDASATSGGVTTISGHPEGDDAMSIFKEIIADDGGTITIDGASGNNYVSSSAGFEDLINIQGSLDSSSTKYQNNSKQSDVSKAKD